MEAQGKSLKRTVCSKVMFRLWYHPTWCPFHPPCQVVLCFLYSLSTSVTSGTLGIHELFYNSSCKVSKWNQSDKCFSTQQRPRQLTQTHNGWTILEMSCRRRISSIFCLKSSRSPSPVICSQFPLRAWSPLALSLWRALAVLEQPIKWTGQQSFNKQSD